MTRHGATPPGRRLRLAAAGLAALVASLAVVVPAGPASASWGDVTCPAGWQTVSYSPGVTAVSQPVTVTYELDLGICVSLSNPAVTSGFSGGTVTVALSCADLLGTTTGTQDFTWNTGQSSTLSFVRTVTKVNGQTVITLAGTISSGLFAGNAAVLTVIEPTLDLLACQSPEGLESNEGVSTFVVL